mmetsp:Transcript_81241/g.143284  ORF Transcript_81241/g.143284 Transcript_81241/m.143284 type:complete len:182 (+) Transcript_81241:157-702(+)
MKRLETVHKNPGSVLHPALCKQPCKYFARGCCRSGDSCDFCHHQHIHCNYLDSKNMATLQEMSLAERACCVLPTVQASAVKYGFLCQAKHLINFLYTVSAKVILKNRSKLRRLQQALQTISLASAITTCLINPTFPDGGSSEKEQRARCYELLIMVRTSTSVKHDLSEEPDDMPRVEHYQL